MVPALKELTAGLLFLHKEYIISVLLSISHCCCFAYFKTQDLQAVLKQRYMFPDVASTSGNPLATFGQLNVCSWKEQVYPSPGRPIANGF